MNMGVKSTMVVSIVVDNRLWGLMSCHAIKECLKLSRCEQQICASVVAMLSSKLAEINSLNILSRNKDLDAMVSSSREKTVLPSVFSVVINAHLSQCGVLQMQPLIFCRPSKDLQYPNEPEKIPLAGP